MENTIHKRQKIATVIALLFHISGFIAIALFHSQLFISLSPLTLLISAALLLWTQSKITQGFIIFIILAFGIGFIAEYIGIHTNILFGQYTYGSVLGPKWRNVPWLIGINWFGIIYCIGTAMSMLQQKMQLKKTEPLSNAGRRMMALSLIIDGAALAVLFDWVLEPVAVQFGYWSWANNEIPSGNYWGWYLVSALVLLLYRILPFPKHNLFAVHLLLIQFMFFLLVRSFY